jgi:hypothetical protein
VHRGFGSRLFAASFVSSEGGKVAIDYRPVGYCARLKSNVDRRSQMTELVAANWRRHISETFCD